MDQFSRIELFYGNQKLDKLKNSHVCVFGLGGVGAICTESLVRSGIGELTLVDFDKVSESNINRQILATHKTIGQSKTEAMKERLMDINPTIKINLINSFVNNQLLETLTHFDYIIDAIDTVSSKIEIYEYAQSKGIPFVSSCGMGNRQDPTKIEVSTLEKTINDPLAKVLRLECKKRNIKQVKVVFSTELPQKQHQELNDSLIRKEKMPPSSLMFVVNTAGLIMSGECIKTLVES